MGFFIRMLFSGVAAVGGGILILFMGREIEVPLWPFNGIGLIVLGAGLAVWSVGKIKNGE